ncbi:hypothetical protein BD311DRAFT_764580 [Dichomitus squalens]|uniref:Uncharacterized protein n=1 Tax=Dichomitus squalens TaxID=114155 RepID=A0A4V2JZK6_9APHY|nr:hypothetical protein BD311DRAFT_764580 [Dichomitus squalens]
MLARRTRWARRAASSWLGRMYVLGRRRGGRAPGEAAVLAVVVSQGAAGGRTCLVFCQGWKVEGRCNDTRGVVWQG